MNEYLDGIFTTENIIKTNNFQYLKYQKNFIKNPVVTFENDPESLELKTDLFNKGLLTLSVLMFEKKLTDKIFKDFCEYLCMSFVYEQIVKQGNLDDFCELQI